MDMLVGASRLLLQAEKLRNHLVHLPRAQAPPG